MISKLKVIIVARFISQWNGDWWNSYGYSKVYMEWVKKRRIVYKDALLHWFMGAYLLLSRLVGDWSSPSKIEAWHHTVSRKYFVLATPCWIERRGSIVGNWRLGIDDLNVEAPFLVARETIPVVGNWQKWRVRVFMVSEDKKLKRGRQGIYVAWRKTFICSWKGCFHFNRVIVLIFVLFSTFLMHIVNFTYLSS